MFKAMFLKYASKFGAVVLAGYLLWLGWVEFGPRKPEMGPRRKAIAGLAAKSIAEDLRRNRKDVYNVILLHFGNDPTNYFTRRLRSVLEQRGIFDLEDMTLAEKIRNKLNFRQPVCETDDEALKIAEEAKVKGVLYGKLVAFESFDDGAKISVEYKLLDSTTGQVVYSGSLVDDSSPSVATPEIKDQAQRIPWYLRVFGWGLVVLLLPIFTISFIRTMVAKHSNKRNFFVLVVYTAIDAILAFLMVGAVFSSLWPVIIFSIAVCLAILYNLTVMSFALKLEQ